MSSDRLRAVKSAVAISGAGAACVAVSETLHFTLRNAYFLADLGASALRVAASYVLAAIALGVIVGLAIRTPRRQALAVAAFYYALVSIKILWFDSGVLSNTVVAAVFVLLSCVLAALVTLSERRLPSRVVPLLVVLAYTNVCLGIASRWHAAGGQLKTFLLSPGTLLIALGGGALLVTTVGLQHWLATRRPTLLWRSAVLAALLPGFGIVIALASRRVPDVKVDAANSRADSPDIYVLSVDALRSDVLDAYIAGHPESHLARLLRTSTRFGNVVSHGSSTDLILANNTFGGARQRVCEQSLPGKLRERGYFTAMIAGATGMRFEGATCYDYYSSGDGRSFADLYMMRAVWRTLVDSQHPADYKYLSAEALLERLANLARNGSALFAYVHVLEMHAPYVPRAKRADAAHRAAIREYMNRCFLVACDPRDPRSAALIDVARRSYADLLDEVDAAVGRLLALAQSRQRSYRIIITADHGELFGEHGGFAHTGGFVPELLDVPFLVHDSRNPQAARRCELVRTSDAFAAVTLDGAYPDEAALDLAVPPLGTAVIHRAEARLDFELSPDVVPHAGTWRNLHRQPRGTLPYPIETCQ